MTFPHIKHPLDLKKLLWPDVRFYKEQVDIIESVKWNLETYVPAGNKLGGCPLL